MQQHGGDMHNDGMDRNEGSILGNQPRAFHSPVHAMARLHRTLDTL